jgi:SAM-dependent methyltransferase
VARVSTLDHWESYWRGVGDLESTYSTGGRLVREILADGAVQGAKILEVGAGSGRDTLGLVRAGAIGFVLDYSPASLALVREQAARQGLTVHVVQADALAMPFRDGAFDVVFHQGLLEHFRDPQPLLRENARVTRRAGRVVVDVPQTVHPYTAMKNLISARPRLPGETQFTPACWSALARAGGPAAPHVWRLDGPGLCIARCVRLNAGAGAPSRAARAVVVVNAWSFRLGCAGVAGALSSTSSDVAEKP